MVEEAKTENRPQSLIIYKQEGEVDCTICSENKAIFDIIIDEEDEANLCKNCAKSYLFEKVKIMVSDGVPVSIAAHEDKNGK